MRMTPEEIDARFHCVDCGVNTGVDGIAEYYMVEDYVWEYARMTEHGGMLCIGCLELRLGITLEPRFFTDCAVNRDWRGSKRLRERLGHE